VLRAAFRLPGPLRLYAGRQPPANQGHGVEAGPEVVRVANGSPRDDAAVSVLGIGAAIVASVLFNVGVALQALEAREAPLEEGLRLSLLRRLLQRPRRGSSQGARLDVL
jgi:hypothetical protein